MDMSCGKELKVFNKGDRLSGKSLNSVLCDTLISFIESQSVHDQLIAQAV